MMLYIERTNANLSSMISLSAGVWNLTAIAYMDIARTKPAARGTLNGITITNGGTTNQNLELRAIIEEGTSGSFIWNINYPTDVTIASVSITPLDITTGTDEQILYFVGGTPIVNRNNLSSPLSLKTGYYHVLFSLSNGAHDTGREEYLHIYQNMESVFQYTFTQDHFSVNTVTSGADSGPGTLRHAITNSAANSTIYIDSSVKTINLTSRLTINKNLTIKGNGVTITRSASWTTISSSSQLLYISSGTVNISRIHFKDGRAAYGAAIYKIGGTLTLESCIFSGNQAFDRNASGGAISNNGVLNIRGCTFYKNSAVRDWLYSNPSAYGGAIYSSGSTLSMIGNLFSGNSASTGYPVLMNSSTYSGNYNVTVKTTTSTAK